jgi:competence CoiA-like predicted nuclease
MIERVVKRSSYKVRLDVSCHVREAHLLTIEIQYSDEPLKELSRRTSLYTKNRIHVLWLLPYPEALAEGKSM